MYADLEKTASGSGVKALQAKAKFAAAKSEGWSQRWNMREVHAVSRPTARDHHTSFLAIATAAVAVDVMRQPAQLWCGGALGRGSEVGSVSREDGHWLPHVVWGITSSASSFSTPGYCVRAASKPNAARACIECCNPTCVCACALGQSLDFVRALYKYFVPS